MLPHCSKRQFGVYAAALVLLTLVAALWFTTCMCVATALGAVFQQLANSAARAQRDSAAQPAAAPAETNLEVGTQPAARLPSQLLVPCEV